MSTTLEMLFEKLQASKSPEQPATDVDRVFRTLLPQYGLDVREPQFRLAKIVERALTEGRHATLEAGTGTGKSFAGLVPAIYHAKSTGKPVIISTGTIALQEQYVQKDIPFLTQVLDTPFTATLAKGKGNYVCLRRLQEEQKQLDLTEDRIRDGISKWADVTTTGDRAELTFEPGTEWAKINCDDSCTGAKCPLYDRCYYYAAKRRLAQANLIVCNHHLFFADLQVRHVSAGNASLLPEACAVIFDEAHHLESVGRSAMGIEVSNFRLPAILAQVRRHVPDTEFTRLAGTARTQNDDLFGLLRQAAGPELRGPVPTQPPIQGLGVELADLARAIARHVARSAATEETEALMETFADRLRDFATDLLNILRGGNADQVTWLDVEPRGADGAKVTLHSNPVDVAGILREQVFENFESVILTSATLAVNRSFEHLRRSIGCPDGALELQVSSPFDYRRQCMLYVPRNLPDPKAPDFHERIAPTIEEILRKTSGRAFVLFTSYKGLQTVHDRIAKRLPWRVLRQGEMPRTQLVELFKMDTHSVLFGTRTFWEGISIEGEALSAVVIDKLPFPSPSDPMFEARAKAIDQQGRSSFHEVSLPEAVLAIKQGFGRLIRTATDRGIVAILDKRIDTKSFGRVFLNSLPPLGRTDSLDSIETFLRG